MRPRPRSTPGTLPETEVTMNTALNHRLDLTLDPASRRRRHEPRRCRRLARSLALLTVPFLVAAVAGPAGAATPARPTHPAGPSTAKDATAVASRIDEF